MTELAVSRDGRRLAASSVDKAAYVWDLAAPGVAQKLTHPSALRAISLSADANRAAVAGDDGVTYLWDLRSGKVAQRLPGPARAVRAVALSGDGKQVVCGGQDNSVRILTPTVAGLFAATPATAEPVTHLVALGQEHGFAALTGAGKQVLRWKPDGTSLPPLAAPQAGLKSLSAAPDGLHLLAAHAQGHGYIWKVDDGKLLSTLALGGPVTDAAFGRDAGEIIVADGQPRVRVFSAEPFRLLEEIAGPTANRRAVCTGTERRHVAWIGSQDSGAVVTRSLERLWDGLSGGAAAIAFSPDGGHVFAAGSDGKIRQWQTANQELVRTLDGHSGAVTDLAVAANGQQLLSASLDKTMRQWSLADGSLVRSVEHPAAVHGVAVRTDGLRSATISEDGQVRVVDLANGVLLQAFAAHGKTGVAVRWLSDGMTLVSGARGQVADRLEDVNPPRTGRS